MGKKLIIKGADFSANAVDVTAPTKYITIAGYGSATKFSDGDYYITTNTNGGIYKKVNGSGVQQTIVAEATGADNEIVAGTFFRYDTANGTYYFRAKTELPYYEPYFGLSEISMKAGKYYNYDGSAITDGDSATYKRASIELFAGDVILTTAKNGNAIKALVVDTDGTLTVPFTNTYGHYPQEYVATAHCIAYLNGMVGSNDWAALKD